MKESKFDPLFWMQPFDQQLRQVLKELNSIAIVGLSDDPGRDSYMVGSYLKKIGKRIVPVNPRIPMVLGERSYPDLAAAARAVGAIDIVDIFRSPEFIPEITDDAIAIGARVLWMQLDLIDAVSADRAGQAGLFVVMNRCLKIEHMKLIG